MFILKKHLLPLIAVLQFVAFAAFAQTQTAQVYVSDWKSYGSYKQINDFSEDSHGRIWAATEGGPLMYDRADSAIKLFNNNDGFATITMTAVTCNPEKQDIYFGSDNGYFFVCDESGHPVVYSDIAAYGFSNPRVNTIAYYRNLVFIGGPFGIAVFDADKRIFVETVTKIAGFNTGIGINKLRIFDGKLYAATESGTAYIDALSEEINNPSAWTSLQYKTAGINESVKDVYIFEDNVYVAHDRTVYVMRSGLLDTVSTLPGGFSYRNFDVFKHTLLLSQNYDIEYVAGDYIDITLNGARIDAWFAEKNSLTPGIYVEKVNAGIYIYDAPSFEPLEYSSPFSSYMPSIAVDGEGRAWVPWGNYVMCLKDGVWTNYQIEKDGGIAVIRHINALSGNYVALSSWNTRYGLYKAKIAADSLFLIRYDNSNTAMIPFSLSPSFVMGEALEAPNGTLWMVCHNVSTSGYGLVSLETNGQSNVFETSSVPAYEYYYCLAIDKNGTKWVGSNNSSDRSALAYLNDNGTPSNKNDDYYGNISNDLLTPNTSVNAIAVDKSGYVWTASTTGLSCLVNPAFYRYKQSPIVRKINLLSNQNINSIVIDASDNKWAATSNGLWVVNSDASEVLAHFTRENSPLVSNNVLSVSLDQASGKIYAGTDIGLNILQTTGGKPLSEYDIKCSPQPFYPSLGKPMIIDGLGESSSVRILTLDGQLVKAFDVTSRAVSWDGTDENGNVVSSGVYIVAGSTPNGSTGVGKIAVIRNK